MSLGLLLVAVGGLLLIATRKPRRRPGPTEQALTEEAKVVLETESVGPPVPEAHQQPEAPSFVAWPADGDFRRGHEVINAAYAVQMKPMEHEGYVGLPTSTNWLTNVAYWMTYPEALQFPGGKLPANFKTVPDWQKFADAWVRIFKQVKKRRGTKAKPNNLFDFARVKSLEDLEVQEERLEKKWGFPRYIMIIESNVPSRSSYARVVDAARRSPKRLFMFVSAKDMKRVTQWTGLTAETGYYVGATWGGELSDTADNFADFVRGVASGYNSTFPSLSEFDEEINAAVRSVAARDDLWVP